MSDDDLGHTRAVAEQLRLAEENGNLPDELDDDQDEDDEVDDVE